jgi:Zn-dependent peptidase ImmA (M78 family)/transcriptional regulator with XRE-family HTH domain
VTVGMRIRQYRTARGFTLSELAERMAPPISKQAISKFEHDLTTPRPTTLAAIARALDVKPSRLIGEPRYEFKILAHRALKSLPVKEAERIENTVRIELERRLSLMDVLGLEHKNPFPFERTLVSDVSDAENAAELLRSAWNLGTGPIANVVETLEAKGAHVVDVDTDRSFDGLAVVAGDESGERVACGIATRSEITRARQRMSHAHETGHLAVDVAEGVDEERVARRFAGAFLYPAAAAREEFGARRSRITADELFHAKRRWGVSIQGILYRLHDLGILDDSGYAWWCRYVNQAGWRREEPGDEPPERSTWTGTYAHRAAAEGLIARETLAEYLPEVTGRTAPADLDRRALMKLPLEERRRVLKAHAEEVAEEYNRELDREWLEADLGERGDSDG